MPEHRTEYDALGERLVPADALYGIATVRALENFPISGRPVHRGIVHAYGAVKLACARTNHELGRWTERVYAAIEQACREMMAGTLDEHVVVDALQGGAGTSTNMNVNEVLCNRALRILGYAPGDYHILHPLDDLNRHQSTNDTFPTAVRLAAIRGLQALEQSVIRLQEAFQDREKALDNVVKVGRTEMQDAVLITLGREMSAYAEALARDRWRIYKCVERLRVVNLGATAVGTGLGAPRAFIFRVVDRLREITGIGFARAENLVDATQNADVFAEVAGILGAAAVNLQKIAGDLILLGSGPDAGIGEIRLPPRQPGSSIMPGKVNPVIPEAVMQAAVLAESLHGAVTRAAARGQLELNAFMPLIADSLLTSIDLLTAACTVLAELCVQGLTACEERCRRGVDNATAAVTALVERFGYENACRVVQEARRRGIGVRRAAVDMGLCTDAEFALLTSPEAVTRLGSPQPPAARGPSRRNKDDRDPQPSPGTL